MNTIAIDGMNYRYPKNFVATQENIETIRKLRKLLYTLLELFEEYNMM